MTGLVQKEIPRSWFSEIPRDSYPLCRFQNLEEVPSSSQTGPTKTWLPVSFTEQPPNVGPRKAFWKFQATQLRTHLENPKYFRIDQVSCSCAVCDSEIVALCECLCVCVCVCVLACSFLWRTLLSLFDSCHGAPTN